MTMYTFEAVVADITASAAGMTSAAETVKAADPTGGLSSISTALPGGTSGAAATALSTAWTERFATWATDAAAHGTARDNSASSYTQADHEASMRMQANAAANRGPAMAQAR